MIKVVKHGQKEFYGRCHRCGCEFSYEVEDICVDYVTCPDCGYIYGWKHSDKPLLPGISTTPCVVENAEPFFKPVDNNGVKPV